MVKLNVIPQLAVIDEEIEIIISEINPHCALTVSVSVVHFDILFLGYGHFFSDAYCLLNVKQDISYGGTYKGLQPMGLFTSMRAMPSKHSCPRLVVKDSVENPLQYQINVWKGHLTQDQVHQLHVKYPSLGTSVPVNGFHEKFFLAKSFVDRTYLSPTVKRIPIAVTVEGEPIRGVLFMPNGSGPFPGVVDVFGAAGGCMEFRSALIAKYGFASLALAYFNYEGIKAKTYSDFDMSYFEKAINWFSGHPMVLPGGVAFVGNSLGAEIVLYNSLRNANVRSAVCINGTIGPLDHTISEVQEIWHGRLWSKFGSKCDIPQLPSQLDHDHPLLFLLGELDLYRSASEGIIDQLHRLGKKKVFQTVIEGQGHMIEPPYSPASMVLTAGWRNLNTNSKDPYDYLVENMQQEWSGDYETHGKGQMEAWHVFLDFLKKHLLSPVRSSKL